MADAIPPYPNQIQDPTVLTQILAVDSSGRLTANQGAAAALSGWWPVKVTDGTNVLPTADAVGRALFSKITDGTNTMPTMDAVARSGYVRVTDGTNTQPTGDVAARRIYVQPTDGTNTMPMGDAVARPIYVRQTDGTNTQPTADVAARALFTKITDGTNTATVGTLTTAAVGLNALPLGKYMTTPPTLTDGQVYPLLMNSAGKLKVEASMDPSGSASAVIIRDPVNPAHQAGVDSLGRLSVTMYASTRRTIELSYISTSLGTLVANMWLNVLWYTVPANYQFEMTMFNCSAGNQLGSARCNRARSLGTYNVSTSTFTDGSAYVDPGFCSSVEAEVSTALTGTAVTLTVTYANQDGVAGRTGTIVCLAAAPLRERFLMTLQAGDFGVRDITAVTKSGGTAGVLTLYGLTTLMYEKMDTADTTYPLLTARESIIVEAGDLVSLEVVSSSVAAASRMVKVVGLLSPV